MSDDYSIVIGDSAKVLRTVKDSVFDLCVTSPPYFFRKEYEDYFDYSEYLNMIRKVARELYRTMKDNTLTFVNINSNGKHPENAFTILDIYKKAGYRFVQEIIWYRRNARYNYSRSRLCDYKEYIFMFAKDGDEGQYDFRPENVKIQIIDKHRIGERFKPIGNVWDIPVQVGNQYVMEGNTASFPLKIPDNCIKLANLREGSIVVDPFLGNGTTIIAALQNGYKGYGIEINEKYVEIAERRISRYYVERVW